MHDDVCDIVTISDGWEQSKVRLQMILGAVLPALKIMALATSRVSISFQQKLIHASEQQTAVHQVELLRQVLGRLAVGSGTLILQIQSRVMQPYGKAT